MTTNILGYFDIFLLIVHAIVNVNALTTNFSFYIYHLWLMFVVNSVVLDAIFTNV